MNICHANLEGFSLHYSFARGNESLSIVTSPGAAGALVLGWRADTPTRVIRITSDARFNVECQNEATIAEFPVAEAAAIIRADRHVIAKTDRERILSILAETLGAQA